MREAANLLNITMRTVAFQKYHVMREFGFRNNTDLIRFAMRRLLG
jgi:DNA-binding CsgD family transcriptional regulator